MQKRRIPGFCVALQQEFAPVFRFRGNGGVARKICANSRAVFLQNAVGAAPFVFAEIIRINETGRKPAARTGVAADAIKRIRYKSDGTPALCNGKQEIGIFPAGFFKSRIQRAQRKKCTLAENAGQIVAEERTRQIRRQFNPFPDNSVLQNPAGRKYKISPACRRLFQKIRSQRIIRIQKDKKFGRTILCQNIARPAHAKPFRTDTAYRRGKRFQSGFHAAGLPVH